MRNRKKGIIITSIAALAILAAATLGYATWVGMPTKGPRIDAYDNPQAALLVVDLQEDFSGPHAIARMRNAETTVKAAGDLVATAVARGNPVAYVRAVYGNPVVRMLMGGLAAPDEPGSQMDRRLPSLPSIPAFTKERGDAFSNPALDEWLRANRVNHLTIVGLDAFYCVDDTIGGALNRGYKVTAVMSAITTGTKRDMREIADRWRLAGVEVK